MNIIKAIDIEQTSNTYLIYAKPGVGKTTFLGTLPGKTLVIDVDRTSNVLQGKENVDIIYADLEYPLMPPDDQLVHLAKSKREFLEKHPNTITEIVRELNEHCNYDNIAIDNLSELEKRIFSEYGRMGKNDGVPCIADYQRFDFKIFDIINAFKSLDKNLFILAWETTQDICDIDGTKYTQLIPEFRSKKLNGLCGICNCVARLEINKEGKRGFRLSPSDRIYAKNQIDDRKSCKVDELIIKQNNKKEKTNENK